MPFDLHFFVSAGSCTAAVSDPGFCTREETSSGRSPGQQGSLGGTGGTGPSI